MITFSLKTLSLALLASMAMEAPFIFSACAMDETVPTLSVRQRTSMHENQASINPVIGFAQEKIDKGCDPRKITFVCDVDGTLTNYSMPSKDHTVSDRDGATDALIKLMEMGVNVVVSSAWDKFDETLVRLRTLGLEDALGITNEKDIVKGTYDKMPYVRLGKVVSVQDKKVDPKYFRQKAYAPYVLAAIESMEHSKKTKISAKAIKNTKEHMKDIQHVIFADDSEGNINYFKSDVRNGNLYPNASSYTYYLLTAVDGTPKRRKLTPLNQTMIIPALKRKHVDTSSSDSSSSFSSSLSSSIETDYEFDGNKSRVEKTKLSQSIKKTLNKVSGLLKGLDGSNTIYSAMPSPKKAKLMASETIYTPIAESVRGNNVSRLKKKFELQAQQLQTIVETQKAPIEAGALTRFSTLLKKFENKN